MVDNVVCRTVYKVRYTNGKTDYIVADGYEELINTIKKLKSISDGIKNFDNLISSISHSLIAWVPVYNDNK